MESIISKILNIPELEYLFDNNDINKYYQCSEFVKSKKFTHLQKCIINTRKYNILNKYIKIYLKYNIEELNKINDEGWTALMLAVRNSNTLSTEKTVKILLKYSPDINIRTKDNITALILAVINSNQSSTLKTVHMLLKNGANINIKYKNMSSLFLSCINSNCSSNEETVKLLLKYKANANEYINYKSILEICYDLYKYNKININILAWLILYGARINTISNDIDFIKKISNINFIKEYKNNLFKYIQINKINIYNSNCINCDYINVKGIFCKYEYFTCLQCLLKTENFKCSCILCNNI